MAQLQVTSGGEEEKQPNDSNICGQIKIQWVDFGKVAVFHVEPNHQKHKEMQIESNQQRQKNEVEESKKEYKYFDDSSSRTVAVGFTAANAACGFGPSGVALGVGIAVVVLSLDSLCTFGCNHAEKKKFQKKKYYNANVQLFNTKLNELKKVENEANMLFETLKQYEQNLNDKTFEIETYMHSNKLLVAIGPSGYGKSLFCNRLLGDKRDIDDLAETKDAIYDVAELGYTKSNTQEIKQSSKCVIIGDGNNETRFILSVVDTQGSFDADGNDEHFQNQMKEYFTNCGGVNMFCIFFKFQQKINSNYRKLLRLYAKFWGKEFWEKCVVIVTNCDKDSKKNRKRLEKGIEKTVKGIRSELNEVSDGVIDDVPIYQFGDENFESSTIDLISSLISKSAYSIKYKCHAIKSPLDKLCDQMNQKLREMTDLNESLKALSKKVDETSKKI